MDTQEIGQEDLVHLAVRDAARKAVAHHQAAIARLRNEIEQHTRHADALSNLFDPIISETFAAYIKEIIRAKETAHTRAPELEAELERYLFSSGSSMRTGDLLEYVVSIRGLPITPTKLEAVLEESPRFRSAGRGWWRLSDTDVLHASSNRIAVGDRALELHDHPDEGRDDSEHLHARASIFFGCPRSEGGR